MAIEKPAPWTGASGVEYIFYVFGLAPDVPKRLGNYIYAKRNAEGAWVPVYMGHGDLSVCCADPTLRHCIEAKAATHVHLRLNSLEMDREAELQDLLAHYANAYAPEGCHHRADNVGSETKSRPRKATVKTAAPKKGSAKKAAAEKTAAKKTASKQAVAKKTAKTKAPTRKTPVKAKPKRPRPPSK